MLEYTERSMSLVGTIASVPARYHISIGSCHWMV